MIKVANKIAILATLSAVVATSAFAGDSIRVSTWGGSYQDAMREAFYTPAAKTLGITINEDSTNGIADVRAQVLAGQITWDVSEQGSRACAQLKSEGKLEPLDYSVINTAGIPKELVDSHFVPLLNFSIVIAWNKDKYGDNGPKSWSDFWDTKRFPGARALRNKAEGMLEIALLADGVAKEDIYKVLTSEGGVDRATEKLKEIAPHVAVWWGSGSQSAQLVKDSEVDMIAIWNNRIFSTIGDGANWGFTYIDAIYDYDCVLIPKGAPNRDLAMKAINEFLRPENQARLPALLPLGPANALAFDTGKIDAETTMSLPSAPENFKLQLVLDPSIYVGRIDDFQQAYDEVIID
jgi:putative spermidine/putrescine transport system substrate-binding protein